MTDNTQPDHIVHIHEMVTDTNQASEDELRDLFGYYCTIEMKRHGVPNEHYQHKIIGKFKSNTWVETPIQSPAKATIHDYQEDVVNVICCGIFEEAVYRVKLSDIKNVHNHTIRTEKLKLLDRLSSHQEDLFWWTGGEYEKTKAVDMRAVAAERDKLTKLEAEL